MAIYKSHVKEPSYRAIVAGLRRFCLHNDRLNRIRSCRWWNKYGCRNKCQKCRYFFRPLVSFWAFFFIKHLPSSAQSDLQPVK